MASLQDKNVSSPPQETAQRPFFYYFLFRFKAKWINEIKHAIFQPSLVIEDKKHLMLAGHCYINFNLQQSDRRYWIAGKNIIIGNFNTAALQSILLHFKKWFSNWPLVCFLFCFWITYATKSVSLRILAIAAILLQIPSVFWVASSRHLLLARTLSIFTAIIYLANITKLTQLQHFIIKTKLKRSLTTLTEES